MTCKIVQVRLLHDMYMYVVVSILSLVQLLLSYVLFYVNI